MQRSMQRSKNSSTLGVWCSVGRGETDANLQAWLFREMRKPAWARGAAAAAAWTLQCCWKRLAAPPLPVQW